MQEDFLLEMFEESPGYLSTFEHLIEKDDNGSVDQYKIAWKYEKRESGRELGRVGWGWNCQQGAR